MKIAVSSVGPTLDHAVDARFGRCAYFLVIDPDTLAFEPIQNSSNALGHGAGIQSAQLLANKGVTVLLTGNCGPNAFQTLAAAGIQVITGVAGQVREAVRMYKTGAMASASGPNVQGHFGTGMSSGGGMGRGMGTGGGRGMGPGMGMGAGNLSGGGIDKEQEMAALREQAENLKTQMEQVSSRLRELGAEK